MSETSDPDVRIEAQGTDVDAAVHLFSDGYNGKQFVAERTDRPFFYRHTASGAGDMTLRNTRFDGHVTGEIAPGADYVVSWMADGRGHFDVGRQDVRLELGQPMVFTTDRPFEFDFSDVAQRLVHFNRSALERVAAETTGLAPGPLHLDHSRAPTATSVRQWRSTIALVSQTIRAAQASPPLRAEMTRVASLAFLEMFPPTAQGIPEAFLLPRNASLRIAVEFVHANAQLPITTTSMAEAAGLSIRALQEGFRRHLDTTPNGYLRGVRLDRAHAELEGAGPGSVALIARRWGFGNLGRFAAEYSARFGENPSRTPLG